jgi:integrase
LHLIAQPLRVSRHWCACAGLVEKARVPHISIHGIRHTVATLLIAAGWDVTEVAHLLGHARPSITSDIYAHVLPHRKREMARNVGRIVMGGDK